MKDSTIVTKHVQRNCLSIVFIFLPRKKKSSFPGYPFANDEARLECLFKLYEKMTAKK